MPDVQRTIPYARLAGVGPRQQRLEQRRLVVGQIQLAARTAKGRVDLQRKVELAGRPEQVADHEVLKLRVFDQVTFQQLQVCRLRRLEGDVLEVQRAVVPEQEFEPDQAGPRAGERRVEFDRTTKPTLRVPVFLRSKLSGMPHAAHRH